MFMVLKSYVATYLPIGFQLFKSNATTGLFTDLSLFQTLNTGILVS